MKENRAAVRLEEETGGLPVIFPIRSRKKDSEEEEEDVVSNQVVLNISMRDWKVFGKQICVFSSKLNIESFLFVAQKYRGHLPLIS